ncbi:MAG: hypothetical protein HOQ28_11145, partial [Thermoleophilia bacterium]|nr:hypothetical protein [Thermoleophilia bacterium]
GCGRGGLREDLDATGDTMRKIRAGVIDFSLLVTPHAAKARNPFGWKLRGPFAFGDVPTARVVYTQIANGRSADDTLVLDKAGGYALVDGRRRSLTDSNLAELRGSAQRVRTGGSIEIGKWIKSASGCGERCARGELDVAAAANTLLELAGSRRTLSDAEADQLAKATRNATYRAEWTDEHLLRNLEVHVDLGFASPPTLREALGKLVGATFDLQLGMQHPRT